MSPNFPYCSLDRNSLTVDAKLRGIFGRTRMAFNFVLGRQSMRKDVTAYDDDVWIVSYPRSGNTWTRFLIANLISRGETVDWSNIERYVPDIYLNHDPQMRALSRPRYLKSHEPYRPEYRRVIFIVRDPRDVAVSYFHFARKSNAFPVDGKISDFVAGFLSGGIDQYGTWGENVGSWLGARRGTPDFTIVRYEDLLQQAEAELTRIAQTMQLHADNGHVHRAVEQSQAERLRVLEQSQRVRHKFLKSSRTDIPFVRAANSGQWQTELAPEAALAIEAAWGHLMRELRYLS